MSPIIYTRHCCDPAKDPEVLAMSDEYLEGATWQCPECDAYWEAEAGQRYAAGTRVRDLTWTCTGRPREQAHVREVEAALEGAATATASAPTVTPRMVQIVLDTYSEHSELGQDDAGDYAECAQCGTGSYGPHTIQAHAREKAAEALQAALAAGETR
ncbi:hypothetical protein [Kocuria rhizophila]|uniref:hypothetical protein n=1 Tax=Kocuria rhizophila TaxID=72000 RepID=UPI00190976E4|nr:hypothetical protein [Kocuria rhizophila]MBK4119702.1 hypothetical protein [Kocuria rhizophila]